MKKALITGITGFAGSFLAEHLLENEYKVEGTYITDNSLTNIEKISEQLKIHKLDLNDSEATENLIISEKPEYIFHLAALASAAESFKNPKDYITNNIAAEVNILEGIKKADYQPKVLVVSSAEVYGNVDARNLPISEKMQLKPVNPYAVSKVAQDFLGLQYFYAYQIPVVIVRPFNHIGPRQAPTFAISSFASKIAAIEKGDGSILKVGNLSAKRDLSDVRDIVRGYRLLLEKGEAGEAYNIGRGESYKIEDILNKLLSLSDKEIKVEIDENLMRPVDVPELICDNSKIKEKTEWEPQIDIDKTLSDTLDYWRALN